MPSGNRVIEATEWILTGTVANRPAAGTPGRLYLPTDGLAIYRDDGSVWKPQGPMYRLTEPPPAGWTWVNQTATGNTASATFEPSGILVSATNAAGAQENVRMLARAAPATPYAITARFYFSHARGVGQSVNYGLMWRESSSGKLVAASGLMFEGGIPAGPTLNGYKWTAPGTYAGVSYFSITPEPSLTSGFFWLRMADTGTNRVTSWSQDGQHFSTLHSVARTDFLTGGADQVGIYLNPYTGTTTAGLFLIDWTVT